MRMTEFILDLGDKADEFSLLDEFKKGYIEALQSKAARSRSRIARVSPPPFSARECIAGLR
jgi:hypothetical protein